MPDQSRRAAFTDRWLKAAKPDTARQEIPDPGQQGLYFVVQPSGAKSWALRYRHAGRTRKMTLAPYPALGLADAREQARDALRELAHGRDPAVERRKRVEAEIAAAERAKADTFDAVVEDFIEKYAKPRQRTWAETRRVLLAGCAEWRERPFRDITKRDAYKLLDGFVADGRHAKAAVTLRWLKTLWRWAWRREIVDQPLMDAVEIETEVRVRTRVYDDDEIRALWKAADAMPPSDGGFVKLLVLLGVRKRELARARWSEFDDDLTLWTIPYERTKASLTARRKRSYYVPLPALAQRIVKGLPRAHDELLFPAPRKADEPFDPGTAFQKRVQKGSGVADWYAHAHRDTISTWLQNAGRSEYERGLALNHSGPGSVTADYSHGYPLVLKRELLAAWADHVAAVVAPKGAEVLR